MDVSTVLTLVLSSAAVSAVVSSLFPVMSQAWEHQARQRELAMKAASDLAIKNWELSVSFANTQGAMPNLVPLGPLTYNYYLQLASVMKHCKLPPDAQKAYEAWLAKEGLERG